MDKIPLSLLAVLVAAVLVLSAADSVVIETKQDQCTLSIAGASVNIAAFDDVQLMLRTQCVQSAKTYREEIFAQLCDHSSSFETATLRFGSNVISEEELVCSLDLHGDNPNVFVTLKGEFVSATRGQGENLIVERSLRVDKSDTIYSVEVNNLPIAVLNYIPDHEDVLVRAQIKPGSRLVLDGASSRHVRVI